MGAEAWSTSAVVRERLRKAWDSGAVLRELHLGPDERVAFPLRIRFKGPTTDELRADYALVRAWARRLLADAAAQGWHPELRTKSAGPLGRQQLPVAARIDTPEEALAQLGAECRRQARTFAHLLAVAEESPSSDVAIGVALSHPHLAVAAAEDWEVLLAVADWLRTNAGSRVLPRQIPVPGMHTKLVEQRRPVLTRLLNAALPPEAVDRQAASWVERYGMAGPVRQVRLRAKGAVVGLPHLPEADVTWPIGGLAGLDDSLISDVVVVENAVSLHVVQMTDCRLVIFGGGYAAADILSAVPWMASKRMRYWGDIDTHGFAILAAVRQAVSHVESVLMDEDTLLAHRQHWVREPVQVREELTGLTPREQDLFDGLRTGRWGDAVRLEQEFITVDLIAAALA